MGQKASKGQPPSPGGKVTRYPVRFGRDDADARGTVYGVFYNLYSARPSVIAVNCIGAEAFNPRTADRRGRRMLESPVVSCAFHPRSSFGPSVLLGTTDGRVTSVELNSLTVSASVPTASAAPRGGADTPASEGDDAGHGAAGKAPVAAPEANPSLPAAASPLTRAGTTLPSAVTAICPVSSTHFAAGHGNGYVALFDVVSGDLVHAMELPEASTMDDAPPSAAAAASSAGTRVTCMAHAPETGVLAVGHANGHVHLFDTASGQWTRELPHSAPPSAIAFLPAYNALLAVVGISNRLSLWRLGEGQGAAPLSYDFTRELEAVKCTSSTAITAIAFDNARHILITGSDDGRFFVRQLERVEGHAEIGMRLLRFGHARNREDRADKSGHRGAAAVTALWYDKERDRMLTGDASGLTRVVGRVTTIPYQDTAECRRQSRRLSAADLSSDLPSTGAVDQRTVLAASTGGAAAAAAEAAVAAHAGEHDHHHSHHHQHKGKQSPTRGLPSPDRVDDRVLSLRWAHGSASVRVMGAMLCDVQLRLPSGRTVRPLADPHWQLPGASVDSSALHPLLATMGCEWAAVPFGAPKPIKAGTPEWEAPLVASRHERHPTDAVLGRSSYFAWEVVEASETNVVLDIAFEAPCPVERIRRTIEADPERPALRFGLSVFARDRVDLPIGVRPQFAVTGTPYGSRLKPGAFRNGVVYPGPVPLPGNPEPEFELKYGAFFSSLDSLPMRPMEGFTLPPVDLSRLPLDADTETVLQLCGTDGSFEIVHDGGEVTTATPPPAHSSATEPGYAVRMEWDSGAFPSCLLRVSNRGKKHAPWSGEHVAVAVEPTRSVFDLGASLAAQSTPLGTLSEPMAATVTPDAPFHATYSISVRELDSEERIGADHATGAGVDADAEAEAEEEAAADRAEGELEEAADQAEGEEEAAVHAAEAAAEQEADQAEGALEEEADKAEGAREKEADEAEGAEEGAGAALSARTESSATEENAGGGEGEGQKSQASKGKKNKKKKNKKKGK